MEDEEKDEETALEAAEELDEEDEFKDELEDEAADELDEEVADELPLEEGAEDETPKSEQEERMIPTKGTKRNDDRRFLICPILQHSAFLAHPFMEGSGISLYNDLGKRKALYDQRIIPFLQIRPNRHPER